MGENKPYKIRGLSEPQFIGITAKTRRDVICRGCDILQIPPDGAQLCLESDGALVNDEEYFNFLEPNTRFVLCGNDDRWTGGFPLIIEKINEIFAQLKDQNHGEEITDFFHSQPSETMRLLVEFISSLPENIDAENIADDSAWFEGMEPRFQTKSGVMFVKAQERVRGYFRKMKDEFKRDNLRGESLDSYKNVLRYLKDALNANERHGVYFKRRCDHQDRLCNYKGWFLCQGVYNRDECPANHMINPYSTRESLVLFSSWNLDHAIEQRTVIQGLKEAIQDCPRDREVNSEYFYNLLFTRRNLKLVDIRCHDRGRHNMDIDRNQFYRG